MKKSKNVGIQPGTVATDEFASKLDKQVKHANEELSKEINIKELTFQGKLKQDQIPGGVGACQPDGGIWFYNGYPIFASEAKKQNDGGNAIERWFKNPFTLMEINSDIDYVTFCTGSGCDLGKPIWKTLHIVVNGEFNVLKEGYSVFLKGDDYDFNFIKETIKKALFSAIEKYKSKLNEKEMYMTKFNEGKLTKEDLQKLLDRI